MQYGERELRRGMNGPGVRELQIRLAAFRGTVPDGDFGAGRLENRWSRHQSLRPGSTMTCDHTTESIWTIVILVPAKKSWIRRAPTSPSAVCLAPT